MNARSSSKILASLLVVALIVPTALFVAAPRAHAQLSVNVNSDFSLTNIGDWIENTISAVANPTTAASTYWTMLKGSVLDPLARALAQAVLKSVTASVVNSINGTNGHAQFVQNLPLNLQQVGDQVGLSFIAQFGSSINSPFSSVITSALRTSYLQNSSVSGFFAANQCTLQQSSPNINSWLAGNWSQGGLTTWFAMTQDQNNPYLLYPRAASQLASVVTGAQANQRQTIAQNNGFLSWCGSGTTSQAPDSTGSASLTASLTASTCYNADGTPAAVQTPGSVIHDQLSKVLGSSVDDLISVHDFDEAVDTVISALITKAVSTGLAALSDTGSSNNGTNGSYTGQITTSTDPNSAATASRAAALAQTELTQLTSYTASWQTIQSAAQNASSALTTLASSCSLQSSAAQTALQTKVNPVLTQAQQALASAATTKVLAQKVQADAAGVTAGSAGANGALTADTQALTAAPPSTADFASAQTNSTAPGSASASPSGSLNVSGSTIVDEMNLLATNAQGLRTFCGPSL